MAAVTCGNLESDQRVSRSAGASASEDVYQVSGILEKSLTDEQIISLEALVSRNDATVD